MQTEPITTEFDFIFPAAKCRDIDGDKLKAARVKICPKMTAFASACGWDLSYQSKLEHSGRRKVSMEVIETLKSAFKCFQNSQQVS